MPALRAEFSGPTRRAFLRNLGALSLALVAVPRLAGCSSAAPASIPLLSDIPPAPAPVGDPATLNFLLAVQYAQADLLRQSLNRAAGRPLSAPLHASPSTYSLRLTPASLSRADAAAAFAHFTAFAYAAASHCDTLLDLASRRRWNAARPNPSGYRAPAPRQNLAALLDASYHVAELTQRSFLAAIAQLRDTELIAPLAAIHSAKCAQIASAAMILTVSPNPRRFETDLQAAPAQYDENELEYFRDPDQLLLSMAAYSA